MTDLHPHASSYLDRHGKRRWRFRHGKRVVTLPGDPAASPAFEAAYEAALTGQPIKKAKVVRIPTSAAPFTLKAAWRLVVTDTPEWKEMAPQSRYVANQVAERFLLSRIVAEDATVWGDMDIRDLRRRHLKKIIADRSDTPHAAKGVIKIIRKMTDVALDQEWIENDPAYRLKFSPRTKGWRAWTAAERQQFEDYYAIGTTPRLVYALALWFGDRRSDIARLKPSELQDDIARFTQKKTGKAMVLAIVPMLQEVLDKTPMTGETVVQTAFGKPFSEKSLTGRFADWRAKAGLPADCKLHGLRKTLGKLLAEGGSTTRQIMDVLGHADIKHAEQYSRDADQTMMASEGLQKVVRLVRG